MSDKGDATVIKGYVEVVRDNKSIPNMQRDAGKAIEFFLSAKEGEQFILYPKALNPFLKAIEGLGACDKIVIIPRNEYGNHSYYQIVKIDNKGEVNKLELIERKNNSNNHMSTGYHRG